MLISLITSCYRGERFLDTFLRDVAQQTVAPQVDLHLILNDPSPAEAGIADAARAWFPGQFTVAHVDREPLSVTWNRCLREGQGDYFAIWNIDDLRTPTSLEEQVAAIRGHDGDAVAFGDYWIDEAYGQRSCRRLVRTAPYLNSDRLETDMLLGPFFAFSRQAQERVGLFDEQLRSALDYDYAMRLLAVASPVRTENPIGWYLNEGSGLSSSGSTLAATERAVVELRYHNWSVLRKIRLSRLSAAMAYDVGHVVVNGEASPISHMYPGWDGFVARRDGAVPNRYVRSAGLGQRLRDAADALVRRSMEPDAVGRLLSRARRTFVAIRTTVVLWFR
jgi:glycosyltransferase involved in cell wall biosynthesis